MKDQLLGDPGAYVVDAVATWRTWCRLGHEGVMQALIAGVRLDGLAEPFSASRTLVDHVLACAGGEAGVHLFVTHDSLVTVAAAHCLGLPLGRESWPTYLEALALVRDGGRTRAAYRGWNGEVRWT